LAKIKLKTDDTTYLSTKVGSIHSHSGKHHPHCFGLPSFLVHCDVVNVRGITLLDCIYHTGTQRDQIAKEHTPTHTFRVPHWMKNMWKCFLYSVISNETLVNDTGDFIFMLVLFCCDISDL
jgi:hypothetical protein